jgi:hypothetical protein
VAQTSKHLGRVAFTLGDYTQAQQCYAQALRISMEIDTPPTALDTLLGLATVMAADGEPEQALEIAAQVLAHPASGKLLRQHAERLKEELTNARPQAARAQPVSFDAFVRTLLSVPYHSEPMRASTSLEG